MTDLSQLAALDGGPGTQEDSGEIFPAKPDDGSIRWHWKHRYGPWGEVFSGNSAGIMGAFTGGSSGPWWQSRFCVRCNRAEYRRVELREDRISAKA
jgi:hypothetical protein